MPNRSEDAALFLGRVFVAALFLPSGFNKLMTFSGVAASLSTKGMPYPTIMAGGERYMRVKAVVVLEPYRKAVRHRRCIRDRADADLIALDRTYELFRHAVALWALHRRGPRLEPDLPCQALGVIGDVARAIVGEPFNRPRQLVHRPKAVFDRGDQQVLHVLTLDPIRRGHMAQHLAIIAVEGKSDLHVLAIDTADLEPVRTPAQVGALHGHAPVVPALLGPSGMALQQQVMGLHDPVDPLMVGWCLARLASLAH
jgi:hypothetical protein